MRWVPFEWALRDIAQGWRGAVLLFVALVPLLFLLLIHLSVEPVRADSRPEVAAMLISTIIVPVIVGIIAILAGGTVMRAPLEDGTLIYQLIRPVNRASVGVQRVLAVALVVAVAAVVSGLSLSLVLGGQSEIGGALVGLFLAGFTFGALYGLLMSLHRFAIALPLIHILIEWAFVSIDIRGVQQMTLSWHLLGAMGPTMQTAMEDGYRSGLGGEPWIALIVGLGSVALVALLFRTKALHLGLPEA